MPAGTDPGQPGRAGRPVPQPAGRPAGAGRAGQRPRRRPGAAAAARLAAAAGAGDQPQPLASLAAADGARLLTLDLLTDAEARELLARRLGRGPGGGRAAGGRRADHHLCARLPLALSIVAARAAARPDFPLAALAAELRDTRSGWTRWTPATRSSVRAVFSWSYRAAQRPGGAAVPAARPAPRAGHHRARRRQPGRRPDHSRSADAGRAGPRPPASPSTPRAGTPSTTCSAPTPLRKPAPMTPAPTRTRHESDCWITTCTPHRLPGTCPTPTSSKPSPWPPRCRG